MSPMPKLTREQEFSSFPWNVTNSSRLPERENEVSEGFGGSSNERRAYGKGSLAVKSSAFLPVSSSLSRLGNGAAPCRCGADVS